MKRKKKLVLSAAGASSFEGASDFGTVSITTINDSI